MEEGAHFQEHLAGDGQGAVLFGELAEGVGHVGRLFAGDDAAVDDDAAGVGDDVNASSAFDDGDREGRGAEDGFGWCVVESSAFGFEGEDEMGGGADGVLAELGCGGMCGFSVDVEAESGGAFVSVDGAAHGGFGDDELIDRQVGLRVGRSDSGHAVSLRVGF